MCRLECVGAHMRGDAAQAEAPRALRRGRSGSHRAPPARRELTGTTM